MRIQKNLLHFTFSFAATNTLIFYVVGLRYFWAFGWWPAGFREQVFLLSSYFGQIALLTFFVCFVLILPVILIFPKRIIVFPWAILLALSLFIFFVLDVNTYVAYRYHFTGQTLLLLFNTHPLEILGLSSYEEFLFYILIGVIFVLEVFLVWVIWNLNLRKNKFHRNITFVTVILGFFSLILSQTIYAAAEAIYDRPLLRLTDSLPYYHGIDLNYFLKKINIHTINSTTQLIFSSPTTNLHYPLHPLITKSVSSSKNILVIMVDTLRFDMLNMDTMPNMTHFAQQAIQFQHHYSGGNATQPGVFSFFYGIPASYWDAMLAYKQDPILLKTAQEQQYRIGIYASAPLDAPAFNKTVFNHISNLPIMTTGEAPWQRDQTITQETISFLQSAKQNKQAFFAFTFYDSVHAYSLPPKFIAKFTPFMDPLNRAVLNNNYSAPDYKNRYKNAAWYVDGLIGKVFDTLKKEDLLNNTIVIITSDHGEEFNENKKNLWGHGSNFSDYQIHVPFIVYWPGKNPAIINYSSSHYDVAPTLLKEVFGVQNAYADYAIGKSFFDPKPLYNFHLALSYHDLGVVEENRITEFWPGADYRVTDKYLKRIPGDPYDKEVMMQANGLLYRYTKIDKA